MVSDLVFLILTGHGGAEETKAMRTADFVTLVLLVVLVLSASWIGIAANASGNDLGAFLRGTGCDRDNWRCDYYVAPINSQTIGVVCDIETPIAHHHTLVFRAFDMSGKQIAATEIIPEEDGKPVDVHNPSFTVPSDGNVHVFWQSGNYWLFAAVLDKTGHVKRAPHHVGDAPNYECVTGEYVVTSYKDKIYGVREGLSYVSGEVGSPRGDNSNSCVQVMDLNHRNVHSHALAHVHPHPGDALAVDDSGCIHLIHNDWEDTKRPVGEEGITEVALSASLAEEERHEVCKIRGHILAKLGATPDPQGTLHVYYAYQEEHSNGIEKLGHVAEKGKKPAKGARVPLMLYSGGGIHSIDKAGAESPVGISAPKRPSRRPAK
jgi:hypothetical protein